MNPVVQWLLDLFYPPKCMLCDRILEDPRASVCGGCVQKLPEYEGADPQVEYFDRCATPFFYEDSIREAVLRFKFQGREEYAREFSQWMAASVRDKLEGTYDLISWVPCGPRRKWLRGYDQAALLAKALAEALGTEAVQTLKKPKDNKAQSRMIGKAQRRANVAGVYRAYEPERFAGKRILLVDDILTTGATLSECGRTLKLAGSGKLVCTVLAVTRKDK